MWSSHSGSLLIVVITQITLGLVKVCDLSAGCALCVYQGGRGIIRTMSSCKMPKVIMRNWPNVWDSLSTNHSSTMEPLVSAVSNFLTCSFEKSVFFYDNPGEKTLTQDGVTCSATTEQMKLHYATITEMTLVSSQIFVTRNLPHKWRRESPEWRQWKKIN